MKRSYQVIYVQNEQNGYLAGDEAAHRAAAALAERVDYPTLEALLDMVTLFERVGGQMYATALRIQNAATGEFDTHGIAFNYETRDARLVEALPPEDVIGIPVTDSQAPPEVISVEVGPPEADPENGIPQVGEAIPADEVDLRDEIEAEVAALENDEE